MWWLVVLLTFCYLMAGSYPFGLGLSLYVWAVNYGCFQKSKKVPSQCFEGIYLLEVILVSMPNKQTYQAPYETN